MSAIGLPELIIVMLIGLFFVAGLGILIYVIWQLIKMQKKVSQIDQLELEMKNLQEEVRSLRESLTANLPH